jgi:hypothetical protein
MKPLYWPIVLNLVGVAIALLYGVGGGSGGETTEGVFICLSITGWLTIVLSIALVARSVSRREVRVADMVVLLLMMGVGFIETRLYDL